VSWSLIGFSAAFFTMFAFLPQIIKVFKTKSVKDVSLVTLVQLGLGVSLWIIYGIHLKNIIIIMANSITLLSLIILLFLYIFYGKPKNEKLL
jgi:MtN3 and saliva related transmembrane protein